MRNAQPTKQEVLSIIDTYEGMLRQAWTQETLARWTEWKAVLCRIEGR